MAALVDTNILVYRFDVRFPERQQIATALLRDGLASDSVRVPHQAIVEFVAATTRPIARGVSLLSPADARREAALRGTAAYQLPWFDAHLWAYAEYYGLSPLYSEDFQHNRAYGTVRAINPFHTPPDSGR